MFVRLRTKLTVLYAALFGATLVVISVAVFTAINQVAQRQVRAELTATGEVFDRIWSLRAERLREGAIVLSRDFGFREAVATGDRPTIVSAMENLRGRLSLDRAFMVGIDGSILGEDARRLSADAPHLQAAFDASETPEGVVMLAGQLHQVMSVPILTPDLIGWVVFAVRLDAAEMTALEKMASAPLFASVMQGKPGGTWWAAKPLTGKDRQRLTTLIESSLSNRATVQTLDQADGRAIALVKPLAALDPGARAVLLLRYPLAKALAPYQPLLLIVILTGALGLFVVGYGSWALARGVTRPITELDQAAHRLQRGEEAHVAVTSRDEIGRLAMSFNHMATAIREREQKITHLALHDDDTGLPNRLSLERVVENLDAESATGTFVAALGIERFDHVRGAIGYALAADLLRTVGERLAGLAPGAGVARIDTDALGFVLPASGREAAEAEAHRLLVSLEAPVRVQGETIDLALVIGLAPLDGMAANRAVELASIGLGQARASRRKVAVFDAEAYGDPASNLSLMSSMLAALEAGEIELFHQPKFDLRRREITGTEALVRWRHPVRGMLPPDLFIPMAEETGHIRALTEWVVRRAVADQATMARAGYDLTVAVNISGRTLGEPDFADFAAEQAALAQGKLCFEITETAVIENPELALAMLDRFADAGVAISIDDYGTGLSSLAYLKQIRGQELKIDRSIVKDITVAQRDALIVRSTIDLAHSLGLKVVAEGVEDAGCLQLLSAMGCDHAQGYLIARPQALPDFLAFMAVDQPARHTA